MFRLLDLFCGAGGAAMGYHQALEAAGIVHRIIGVDNKPMKRYPFEFVLGDALEYARRHSSEADFIHASPPCLGYSEMTKGRWQDRLAAHDKLIPETRQVLQASGKPYTIENVAGARAELTNPVMLCGTMFGLQTTGGAQLWRHRYFELSFWFGLVPGCQHARASSAIGVYGGGQNPARKKAAVVGVYGHSGGSSSPAATAQFSAQERGVAMGIDWMTQAELSQAIPPAYTRWIMERYLDSK